MERLGTMGENVRIQGTFSFTEALSFFLLLSLLLLSSLSHYSLNLHRHTWRCVLAPGILKPKDFAHLMEQACWGQEDDQHAKK